MAEVNRREYLDPTPVAMPAGFGRPEPLVETIKRMVRNEMSHYAQQQGAETFEEANDFDIDGEELPHSPYEEIQMSEEYLDEIQKPEKDSNHDRRRTDHVAESGADAPGGTEARISEKKGVSESKQNS